MGRTLLMRIDKLFERGVAVRDTCFVLTMTQPDVTMKKAPTNNEFITTKEKLKVDIPSLHLQTINWRA